MADAKDNESFFRKVVRFVANPATDWHELNSRQDEGGEDDLEKSELKAMVERKRRNDFVRRREFDMLRRVRREGLTPEQLAALGGSSRLDDSDARTAEGNAQAPAGVKAKIDEIEQQMVGGDHLYATTMRRSPSQLGPLSTRPGLLSPDPVPSRRAPLPAPSDPDALPAALPPLADDDDRVTGPTSGSTPMVMGNGLPPLASLDLEPEAAEPGAPPPAVEINEVAHDPDLDEAVIAFANADFDQCESILTRMVGPHGTRSEHADTWLVLFDLFRAVGHQQRFESLAVQYAQRFGWSAPQWYSMPKMVADAVAEEAPRLSTGGGAAADVGWAAPKSLDTDSLSRLRSQTLQMPLPWVFDWSAVERIDAEAATQLSVLCRLWAAQALEMRWIGADRLFAALQEAAPTGVRDADPAFWLARLDALRLANRADQFDEAAIDYCVTYEVSPPAWEPARCVVRLGGTAMSTRTPPMSVLSDVATSFMESDLHDASAIEVATVSLSGQLLGDIGDTLQRLTEQIGNAPMVSVSCARLIRVDFLAAGDLLNWVLARRTDQRSVQFVDAHRLVALFFSAMGISEHAQVQIKKV